MAQQILTVLNHLREHSFISSSSLRLRRQLLPIALILFFAMTGCSSLHVDVSPTVDWTHVKAIEFQDPPQDLWQLSQSIKSELKTMGFQLVEAHQKPDLLFSYFTQESRDLTVESEVITRLKSLHVQFIDPATKTLVTAADYFYPDVADMAAAETGVEEIFLGLRQQIQNKIHSPSEASAISPAETIVAPAHIIATPDAQTNQPKSESTPIENNVKDNTGKTTQSKTTKKEVPNQEPATTILEKSKQLDQAIQKTHSPWLPKFKSWGFENWGQDAPVDY